MLPLSEKVKVHKERKELYAEVAKIYNKNDYSICEIVKKEKEICPSLAVASQTAKFTAMVPDKGLVKMEKVGLPWWHSG